VSVWLLIPAVAAGCVLLRAPVWLVRALNRRAIRRRAGRRKGWLPL
jgi:hypothetical protein